ncbi:MAG: tRNA (adenosine(37)-N6)-dimethylallyltransferase MiaA [Candidatus Omnitrophica bacterium]|nr:tRNA (adenosine(37)-N6)-dimethylallyltransferase MiaA [Candidatus Omnitrophota bacterium]
MTKKKIIFIVGPTAVGKTDVAFWLAKKLKTQIISCDAMQVYKEVSILTGKPSLKMLGGIKHYLIDVISVAKNFDVSMFRQEALKAICAIEKKKTIPIVVGGSGLYMSVLLDGIFEEKDSEKNFEVRKRIEENIKNNGREEALERLKEIDPISASRIHANDVRRLVRALEVFEVCGKPISQLHPNREGLWGKYDICIFVLNRDRDKLYSDIDKRVDKMFQKGAVKEIENIKGKKISRTAKSIIGFKEISEFLDGRCDLEQTKEIIKKNTRNFAKRQLTWFRRDQRLEWINIKDNDTVKNIGEQILREAMK